MFTNLKNSIFPNTLWVSFKPYVHEICFAICKNNLKIMLYDFLEQHNHELKIVKFEYEHPEDVYNTTRIGRDIFVLHNPTIKMKFFNNDCVETCVESFASFSTTQKLYESFDKARDDIFEIDGINNTNTLMCLYDNNHQVYFYINHF